jgi:KDO2-lipid IV(A) lauroyltransferase
MLGSFLGNLLYAATWLVAKLPPRPTVKLAGGLGRMAARLGLSRRRVAEENIRRAFGDSMSAREVRRIAIDATGNLYMGVVESVFLSHRPPEWVNSLVEEVERGELMPPRGEAAISISGHFGSWELLGAWFAQRLYIATAAKPLHNPHVQAHVARARARVGLEILWVQGDDLMVRIGNALSRGRIVNLLYDQDAGVHGAFVPFFGHPASTILTPAIIAIRKRLMIRPAFIVRIGPCRHRIVIRPPIDPKEFKGPLEERAHAIMQRLNAEIEDLVRLYPTQYFWHHRRWRTTPEAARKRLETLERRRKERAAGEAGKGGS